jgi:protein-S-isoprenylcysteine O-methyltransferase Ste14
MKNILPPTYLWISIGVMIALHFLLPLVIIVPWPWSLAGIIQLALGAVINILADREFKEANTTVKPFKESSAMITDGVFQISRNPMYLGFALILIGIAVLLGSLTPFVVIPIFALLMDQIFIRVEEQMLEEKFVLTWLDYKRRVRRWI